MSCRVIKNKEPHHLITIRGDRGNSTIVLVGPRIRQYLAMHPSLEENFISISGPKTLRALALAILGRKK